MNVNTMRVIDRYAGVPICFVLASVYWLVGLVTAKRKLAVGDRLGSRHQIGFDTPVL